MQKKFQELFLNQWKKYFLDSELPIGYYYSDQIQANNLDNSRDTDRCLIGNLNRVREGYPYVYSAHSPGCSGGKRYSGYSAKLRPNFEYFLSCGIPGKVEGERYKKTPELVQEFLKNHPPFKAPGKYLVFKRFDKFSETEEPIAYIFFAAPDVLSGLFTLANYDRKDPNGVTAPMGSGCSSILNYPIDESQLADPRCVLGMFDVSARPSVPANTLTFTIPANKFESMVNDMDESFLITGSWKLVEQRL
ncbi:MAG: DUF169 domain-containing protein [Calditrichia bacterium]